MLKTELFLRYATLQPQKFFRFVGEEKAGTSSEIPAKCLFQRLTNMGVTSENPVQGLSILARK
jgi:hypothetical protein